MLKRRTYKKKGFVDGNEADMRIVAAFLKEAPSTEGWTAYYCPGKVFHWKSGFCNKEDAIAYSKNPDNKAAWDHDAWIFMKTEVFLKCLNSEDRWTAAGYAPCRFSFSIETNESFQKRKEEYYERCKRLGIEPEPCVDKTNKIHVNYGRITKIELVE